MEKIQAAIIGLGRIASLLEGDAKREKPCTHAGAISANPDCVLAGGFDIDEGRRKLFAERWNAPVFTSPEEMIREVKPEILVVATHPDSHYFYCRLAAAAGVPVVICEKPLADNLHAARKIARLTKQKGREADAPGGVEESTISAGKTDITRRRGITIITNHERRYSADYIHAKEILASERLGKLLSVRAVLYMGKHKRLLDVFWHDGTHLADAIMFLTGLRLQHRKRRGASLHSTTGTAWLKGRLVRPEARAARDIPAPVPVIMEVGAGRDHLVFETEFSSEKGRLRIGNGVFEVWESGECPYAEKFRSLKPSGEIFEGPTGYFANMISDAVLCVKESGRVPVSSAAAGLAVIEYLHSVKSWRK